MTAGPDRPRVLELGTGWTRAAGRMLVGLGWDVVLVEPPGGSPERTVRDGIPFTHWHAGKSSVLLDPAADPDRWRTLVAGADVILHTGDLPAGVPTRVATVRISPYGSDGPAAGLPATDLTVAARGGMLAQVGTPDSPPLRLPQDQAEQLAGAYGAIAAVLSVAGGRWDPAPVLEVSALEAVAACLETGALTQIHADRVDPRPGRHHPLVLHGLFRTADGYVGGGLGGSPRMWDDLLGWLAEEGVGSALTDPRWATAEARAGDRTALFAALDDLLAGVGAADWAERAQARRLPWAAVDPPHRLRQDPQLLARDFFRPTGLAGRVVPDLGFGVRVEGAPTGPLQPPAPGAGQPAVSTAPRAATGPAPAPVSLLDGVRVVDLTWVLAGPFATRVLADHGAEVIKVESVRRPDPTRFNPAMHLSRDPAGGPDASGYFNEYNRNKHSIALDTRTDEGRAVLADLVASADVVVENFSASVMTRMGLGYDELRRLRPDIVYLSMSGMGHTGPRRDWVTYADIVSAASGLTALTGWGPDDVVGVIYGHADIVAGLHGALAVVAALARRRVTGRGAHLDLSQLEASAASLGTVLLDAAAHPEAPPVPLGNADPDLAPHGVHRCLGPDAWVAVAVRDTTDWAALCRVLDRPDWATDPSYATAAGRRAAAAGIDAALGAWAGQRSAADAADALLAAGVPAAPVQDGRDLLADAQLAHRGFFQPVEHPVAGRHPSEASPIRTPQRATPIRRPAPVLGADTGRLLAALGYPDERIAALAAQGVLR